MRVYIGPYTNTWIRSRVHCNYMDKKYGIMWETNQTKFEHWLEKYEDFLQGFYNLTINKILCRRKQKIKVRIDHYDTWGMDHTLSLIILPMLKQLRDTKHGSPMVDDADVPEHLRSTAAPPKENEWDSDDLVHERWSWVLDEMIWTFEQLIDEDSDSQFCSGEHDIYWEKIENGNSEMKKGPNDTFTIDREGLDAHNKRINNALILFGKYFRGLWD